jgi:hypothetical protein
MWECLFFAKYERKTDYVKDESNRSNVTLWVILMLAAACAAGGLGIFAVRKGRRRR